MQTVWPSSPRARLPSPRLTRALRGNCRRQGHTGQADAREAAYAKAVKAYQDQIAAREAAYIKAVLGK